MAIIATLEIIQKILGFHEMPNLRPERSTKNSSLQGSATARSQNQTGDCTPWEPAWIPQQVPPACQLLAGLVGLASATPWLSGSAGAYPSHIDNGLTKLRRGEPSAPEPLGAVEMLEEVARVLKSGGRTKFLVGNSCLKGVFIKNSDAVEATAQMAGLDVVEKIERELPVQRRYLPVLENSALGKRMRTETIISMQAA